jgi:hypothetical protein
MTVEKPYRRVTGEASGWRLGFADWLARGDCDDARLCFTAQYRAAERALPDEQYQRGLRPTRIRQRPLPHRCWTRISEVTRRFRGKQP